MEIKCFNCKSWQYFDNGYPVCRNCGATLSCDNNCIDGYTVYKTIEDEYLCLDCCQGVKEEEIKELRLRVKELKSLKEPDTR